MTQGYTFLVSLLSILQITFFAHAGIFDLEQHGYEQYQDIYLNGKVVKKASSYERYEEQRFQIVDSILSRYTRSFTMLDIGASQGYFTFRAAEKYPQSVFIMLEGSNSVYPLISKQLHSICQANQEANNVVWLDRPICPKDFERLSQCEHVDVILAQNILHWFPDNWKGLLDNFLKMSYVTIIELPPNEKSLDQKQYNLREDLHSHLASIATKVIKGVPRHTNPSIFTTYYIVINETGEAILEKTSMVHPSFGDREHRVLSSFHQKSLCKKDLIKPFNEEVVPWQPGINLITYLSLNGQYPSRKELAKSIIIDREHLDWMPNNMIVQGGGMVLIDKGDPKNEPGGIGKNPCSDVRIQRCKQLVLTGDENAVRAFFRDQSQ